MRSVIAACAVAVCQGALVVDKSAVKDKFWGLGGLSGGGATSRLLVDYKEPQRSQILDYLFLPNFGASLQILKVEIGGDSQSTDGTETSHMHTKDDLDVTRGYEWWLMKEAKKRNPAIKLYGLPWAFPGWVGNDPKTGKPSGSPFTYPNQTALYITNWVKGAKDTHGLDIDYIGVWNERSSSAAYTQSLRKALADAGFPHIQIVAKDGGADICNELAKDPAYDASVDIIGLHYPSDYSDYSQCHKLKKPFWSSEESSSYDDYNGAACWARVVNSHYVLSGMTSNIMWNLVGAYYHGTNWYASSMLTAVEPWSGHFQELEVVWATAHVTQFTQIGWEYLAVGSGSGKLPEGGFYTTIADPESDDFTMMVVKISHDHAACTRPGLPNPGPINSETVTFTFKNIKATTLAVWKSNYETNVTMQFEQLPDARIVNGQLTLRVNIGDYITLTTKRNGRKGHYQSPPSQPQFPLPHIDNFNEVVDGQEGAYLTDQIGAFEVHSGVLRQMVPQIPIGWSDHGSNGPLTLIGMKEFQDLDVQVDVKLPNSDAAGCVATRVNQMWTQGIALCVYATGHYNLTRGGPPQSGKPVSAGKLIKTGTIAGGVPVGKFFTLRLSTYGNKADGWFEGRSLFASQGVPGNENGFAGLGANTWYAVEYDNLSIKKAGDNWNPRPHCAAAKKGDVLYASPCTSNGFTFPEEKFTLESDWSILHEASGLCVTARGANQPATLQTCNATEPLQRFKNDYTRIRNQVNKLYLRDQTSLFLAGNLDGHVAVQSSTQSKEWSAWSYYPNTHQLRNQYDNSDSLGYPYCLTTCRH